MSAPYLGDFRDDQTVHFIWSTNNGSGASITRATNGTVSVYKDNGTTQTTTGVTDTEDFDALTGIHACTIVTTDAFYATGANYTVVLSAATIDGQTVNAVLAHFSIENRSITSNVTQWLGTAAATPTVAGVPEVDITHIAGAAVSTTTAQLGVNVVQVSTDATAADNLEAAFDGTGYAGGTIKQDVNAVQISGDSVAADNAEAFFDGTGYAGTGNTIPTVTTVSSVTAVAAGGITASSIAADAIGASELAADAVAEIADAIWDEARAGHVAAGSFGEGVASVQGNVTGSVGSVTGAVGSVTGAVGSVTGNVGGNVVGNVTGSVGSLAAQAKADVNAEVVDGLSTDTYAEPGQGTPAATLSLAAKIGYVFKAWRNRTTQTSSTYSLFNDDAVTVDQKATTADDGATFSRTEITTGP